jgi:hypothetical protein
MNMALPDARRPGTRTRTAGIDHVGVGSDFDGLLKRGYAERD